MEQMENFCVSYHYGQRELLFFHSSSYSRAAAIHTYPRAAAAAAAAIISLKVHPKHVTKKNKTKHIMKISHINVNIYGNSGRKVS
jgi:hypothetical protein